VKLFVKLSSCLCIVALFCIDGKSVSAVWFLLVFLYVLLVLTPMAQGETRTSLGYRQGARTIALLGIRTQHSLLYLSSSSKKSSLVVDAK